MQTGTDVLNELLRLTQESERFYLDAVQRLRSAYFQSVLRELAESRRRLVLELSQHVTEAGRSPAVRDTLTGKARKAYASTVSSMGGDEEAAYVGQLQQLEARLATRYREAMAQADSEDLRKLLQRHLLAVNAAREKVIALQELAQAH